ncbi:hypothetical protein EMIT07CA2_10648 [Brevibacillus sp. IT-7CA2]
MRSSPPSAFLGKRAIFDATELNGDGMETKSKLANSRGSLMPDLDLFDVELSNLLDPNGRGCQNYGNCTKAVGQRTCFEAEAWSDL